MFSFYSIFSEPCSRQLERERENERKFYLRFALTSKCLSLTKIVYDIETHKQQFERISLVFIAVRNISKSGSDQRNRLLLIIHSRALLHQCLLNAVSLRFWFSSLSCIWSSFNKEMRKNAHITNQWKVKKPERNRKRKTHWECEVFVVLKFVHSHCDK